MVGWHHHFDRHEFEQALRVGDGQGSLLCCSPWGHKELDMTEQLNLTEIYIYICMFFLYIYIIIHLIFLFVAVFSVSPVN